MASIGRLAGIGLLAIVTGLAVGFLAHRATVQDPGDQAIVDNGPVAAPPGSGEALPVQPEAYGLSYAYEEDLPAWPAPPLPVRRPSSGGPAVAEADRTAAVQPGDTVDRPSSLPAGPSEPMVARPPVPRIAIVIDDVGLDRSNSAAVIALPAPLTLSFLPYAPDLVVQTRVAAARGHELMVHLPMQPMADDIDPGPNALFVDLDDGEIARRVDWALTRFDGYAGVNNHMGSRFTARAEAMRPVLLALRGRGLFFLDSRTSPDSVAGTLADQLGLAHATRDVFLDHDRDPQAIRDALAQVEALALLHGSAIAIGHPYPETLAVLAEWLAEADERGLDLVPVSALVTPGRPV